MDIAKIRPREWGMEWTLENSAFFSTLLDLLIHFLPLRTYQCIDLRLIKDCNGKSILSILYVIWENDASVFSHPLSFFCQDSSGNGIFNGTLKSFKAGSLPVYDGSSIDLVADQENYVEIPATFGTYLANGPYNDFTLQVTWNPTTVSKLINVYG